MTVDGVPNVRVCTEPIREGAVVEGQNVRWSLDLDFMSITDKVGGPFTPVGFYYRLVHPAARGMAAVREVPAQRCRPRQARSARRPHAALRHRAPPGAGARRRRRRGRPHARRSARRRMARASSSSTRTLACGISCSRASRCSRPPARSGSGRAGSSRSMPTPFSTASARSRIVVATGAIEQPLVFPGNDLVGVMLPDGVRRLIRDFSIKPGERAIVLGADDETLAIAAELEEIGVEVAKVVDLRDARPRELAAQGGKGRVRRLVLDGESVDCDLLVASAAASPPTRCSRRPADASSSTTLSASSYRPSSRPGSRQSARSPARGSRRSRPSLRTSGKGKCFVCVCEDVTTKDIKRAIGEGFDSIELAKRYTTTTMGPCQGKLCHLSSIRVYAQENAMYESAIGTTTARPPWSPVELGLLAGRDHTPARRRSIHWRHEEAGARSSGQGRGSGRTRTASIRRTRCARCTSRSASSTSRRSGSSSSRGRRPSSSSSASTRTGSAT